MDRTKVYGSRIARRAGAGLTLVGLALLAITTGAEASSSNWPRQFDSPYGSFIIYQPQPETLNGDLLTGRAAFSLQRSTDPEPTFGVIWFAEQIQIDRDSSTVQARNFDVTKVRLPGITEADASRYEHLVESEALKWDLSGSLEELQSGLASAERERASVAGLDTMPPKILFTQQKSLLVVFDGSPFTVKLDNSDLERVANTPYAIVHDPSHGVFYLNGSNLWYSAGNPLGPWSPISNPPDEVRASVPPDTSATDVVSGPPPAVVTATEPTELIWTDGPPQYASLVEGELLYVTNTESDVVRDINSQQLYVLLSGRWYRAPRTTGPWTFVRGDRLPASFGRIPPASPKANLRASVAGTDEADDALADAEIPQTSPIRRDSSGYQVYYDGAPDFEPIDGTQLKYAVNTEAEVILADGRYYACDQGVWYVADDPMGPWRVSQTRPVEVDEIPPSCPVYDVRYVYIYDVTPDIVYFGYLPGYLGCYPYYGTVVFGTGYHYRAWRRHFYYPRPCTWGFGARYNPWLSRWWFGFSYQSGFLRVGFNWHPWPRYREIRDPVRWLGPGGYRRPTLMPDLSMARTRQFRRQPATPVERTPINIYRRSANLPRVDKTVARSPLTPARATPRTPAKAPNDVFAGRDGKVYRREQNGWKVNQGRNWVPAPVTATPRETPAAPARAPVAAPPVRNWPPPAPTPQRRYEMPPVTTTPVAPPSARPQRVQPPPISPSPGDLEREFRGRQRSGTGPTPVAPPPRELQKQPQKKEIKKNP